MTIECFEKIIALLKEEMRVSDNLHKAGFDDFGLKERMHEVVSHLFKAHYSEEGEDMISWWLYENVDKTITYKNGKKRNLTDIKKLWKYIEEIRNDKNFKEYIPKKPLTTEEKENMLKQMFNLSK